MGFFSDLKEDLSQAVNELVPEGEDTLQEVEELEEIAPASADDLGKMLENMDLDSMLEPSVAEDVMEQETVFYEKPVEVVNTGVVSDETAVITKGMLITGDINSQGSIDIIGTVRGNIDALGKLNVTGAIEGNSHAADIYAEKARITGEVKSEGSIKIGADTIIIGNIFAKSAIVAGAVKGDIDVRGPVLLDSSAIVMGNIKSKSVQINNGAVIEGLCSQCYADVNPTSFFDDIKKARK